MGRAAGLTKRKKPYEAFEQPRDHDPMSRAKSNDPISRKADAGAAAQRKDLLEDSMILLQNSIDNKVSGILFQTKLDMVGNYLHELEAYAASLKNAMLAIQENHPSPVSDNDEPLMALSTLAEVLVEGASRSKEYLTELRAFAADLNTIRTNMYTQMQIIHQEL